MRDGTKRGGRQSHMSPYSNPVHPCFREDAKPSILKSRVRCGVEKLLEAGRRETWADSLLWTRRVFFPTLATMWCASGRNPNFFFSMTAGTSHHEHSCHGAVETPSQSGQGTEGNSTPWDSLCASERLPRIGESHMVLSDHQCPHDLYGDIRFPSGLWLKAILELLAPS